MHDGPTCSPQPWKHVSVYLLIFLNFFLTYDPLPFRQLSELEFQLLSDFAKVKVWATEKVRSGSSKKMIKTRLLILSNYISHLSELEFYFLCDCTNQKRKTIERCVKERLEQVVRVQLWRDFRTRDCSRVIIQMFHANYLKHLKD